MFTLSTYSPFTLPLLDGFASIEVIGKVYRIVITKLYSLFNSCEVLQVFTNNLQYASLYLQGKRPQQEIVLCLLAIVSVT